MAKQMEYLGDPKGCYYVDLDEDTGCWCVFHEDTDEYAYACCASYEDAFDRLGELEANDA